MATRVRLAALASLALAGVGCAHGLAESGDPQPPKSPSGPSAPSSPYALFLTLNRQGYQPGEAVVIEVTLRNDTATTQAVTMPNQSNLSFSYQPVGGTRNDQIRFVEPVTSGLENQKEMAAIGPGLTIVRKLVFPQMTLERGEYVVQGIYARPDDRIPQHDLRTYSKAVAFTVAGEAAFAHRYANGLLTKEDAVALAERQAGRKAEKAEAIMVLDEAGFLKWWVNLTLLAWGEGALKNSFFVDPYLAKVWREAKPFNEEDRKQEVADPHDAKLLQKLREKLPLGNLKQP